MVNLFVISLGITVIINVLQDITKFLHEKTLKAIDLKKFHSKGSEKNNSQNDHFNEL